MRAVIIEDNFSAYCELLALLEDNHPDVSVVGYAASQHDGLRLLRECTPELVFMDIELADGGNGFAVLEEVTQPDLWAIFVSSFTELAFRAFRFPNAVDFLEKPVDEGELAEAIGRAKQGMEQRRMDQQIAILRQQIQVPPPRPRISLADQRRIVFPYVDSIVHIKADRETTHFFFSLQPERMTVSKNIGEFKHLTLTHRQWLIQVNRSHIVGLHHVVSFMRADRVALLSNGHEVPVSEDFLKDFLDALGTVRR